MTKSRIKLYSFIFFLCLSGYFWLGFQAFISKSNVNTIDVCLFKSVTNFPCPSCGTTRAIVSIMNGEFLNAFYFNPLGYLVLLIMTISPCWILVDLVIKSNSFQIFYIRAEVGMKKPLYFISFIVLIIATWIWNLSK